MEFDFSINSILSEQITKIDRNKFYSDNLTQIIDKLGVASAKAQSLNGPITSAARLKLSQHQLYLIKDPDANSGKGAAVGLLKIGNKKLFIYDHDGTQHEVDPLCVLDFYIHESRQRMGFGKLLFDTMLKAENVEVSHLAVDRPSHKFLKFLQKHYKMKTASHQVNNFVVFDGFFKNRKDKKPTSSMNRSSSGLASLDLSTPEKQKEALRHVSARPNPTVFSPSDNICNLMGAQKSLYSRHFHSDKISHNLKSTNMDSNGDPRISEDKLSLLIGDKQGDSPLLRKRDGPSICDNLLFEESKKSLPTTFKSDAPIRSAPVSVKKSPQKNGFEQNGLRRPQSTSWNIFGVPP